MKKFGFTLAEVLITLTIIGVVAMMTLPALMTNVQEQQAITGLKKGINTLSEAGQMNAAMNGFDYSSVTETGTDEDDQSLTGLFRSRLQVDLKASGFTGTNSAYSSLSDEGKKVVGTANSNYFVMFLRDGAAIAYKNDMKVDDTNKSVLVYYDINGAKGPNLLSNCSGDPDFKIADDNTAQQSDNVGDDDDDGAGTIANWFKDLGSVAYAADGDTETGCSVKSNRVIKDQFVLRLQGGYATTDDDTIEHWILNNR